MPLLAFKSRPLPSPHYFGSREALFDAAFEPTVVDISEQRIEPIAAVCTNFLMGRAGFEPATLGLKVPCSTS
jgi:hypothetical protein